MKNESQFNHTQNLHTQTIRNQGETKTSCKCMNLCTNFHSIYAI